MAVVTPTSRPKSVCTRCVIELFLALFVLSLCPYDISVGVLDFVIGLSEISSFFSYIYLTYLTIFAILCSSIKKREGVFMPCYHRIFDFFYDFVLKSYILTKVYLTY